MVKKNKKKEKETETVSIGEFLEKTNNGVAPVYKEIGDGPNKKVINISEIPVAPQNSFEINIKAHILKSGPPYHLVAKNIPYDATIDQIREFFECADADVQLKYTEFHKPSGVVVVGINNLESYKIALEKDGFKMGNRPVHLTQGKTLNEIEQPKFGYNSRGGNRRRNDYQSRFSRFDQSELEKDDNWRSGDRNMPIVNNSNVFNPKDDTNWRSSTNSPNIQFSNYNNPSNRGRGRGPRSNFRGGRGGERSNESRFQLAPDEVPDLSILRNPNKKNNIAPPVEEPRTFNKVHFVS